MKKRMGHQDIIIKGARVNNLKNIDVKIPRNKLVVITGLSGSGKSSLAFDTVYAEGHRRYVESLSSYARQFLGRMKKPDCDFIRGLPPAIAIEQRTSSGTTRSTVGTRTEIYDYLQLLFSRIGKTFSPISGEQVRKHTAEDVVAYVNTLAEGTRIALVVDIHVPEDRTASAQLEYLREDGYSRLYHDGHFEQITDVLSKLGVRSEELGVAMPDEGLAQKKSHADHADLKNPADGSILRSQISKDLTPSEGLAQNNSTLHSPLSKLSEYKLLVDRVVVSRRHDDEIRLLDSLETAFYVGHDQCSILAWMGDGSITERKFSKRFELDGMTFLEPTEAMFNFNNPLGACPTCQGFGSIIGIDEDLVVPNKNLSIYEDAVSCWRGEVMSEEKRHFVRLASRYDFPIHKPYRELTAAQRDLLWHGSKDGLWHGIDGFFEYVRSKSYAIQWRVLLSRYRGKTICPTCHGSRLRVEASYVKVGGKTIGDMVSMPVTALLQWFREFTPEGNDALIAKRLLKEIVNRLQYLEDVGLGYLTLNRLSSTLSGGESQRISLASSLGSSLVGSIYILDEPSIGLHSRDTDRLINVLRRLQGLGNTVLVVEHDEEIMRAADWLIDIGPEAGRLGGEVVFQGPVSVGLGKISKSTSDSQVGLGKISSLPDEDISVGNPTQSNLAIKGAKNNPTQSYEPLKGEGYTARYLSGELQIPVPKTRRRWSQHIDIKGCSANNLKNIDVRFPLGVMTVVTGVSGSGKSTLVEETLYRALARHFGVGADAPGSYTGLSGDISRLSGVEMIDQQPIGRSTRSNPATYIKAYDEIRRLFAEQQLSKQMGYGPGFFSFNSVGGRCEECKGEGTITIEMQFMADITLPCEACHGKRFGRDALQVVYRGRTISDVLDMTVNEAIEFFSGADTFNEAKIVSRLQPLREVGLGYVKLGQSSATLSGGENQRLKLAFSLSAEHAGHTLYIFDEPTTGLHFHDINTLLGAFNRLIAHGDTVVIIEHNLDVIKCADHVIDLGPEGGAEGGNVVVAGTPEEVAQCGSSYTGQFLKTKLHL